MIRQNKSACEYRRRRRLGVDGKHISKTMKPRYQYVNTLTHQRTEEGMDKWIEYVF